MFLYENKLWQEDLNAVIEMLPDLDILSDKSILITGAAGLICSAVVDVLCRYNDVNNSNIKVYVAGRNEEKMKSRYDLNRSNLHFVPYDASRVNNLAEYSFDYIIHGASNASPNNIVAHPVETMLSNFFATRELLEHMRQRGGKRLLFISTSEVYGRKENNGPSKVNDYGWIDILNPRSSYSIGKCAAETLLSSYYDEYGVESVIIRPGHIYGPTAQISDNRVSSAWAYAVARGEDIIMKSDGSQLRSYCYCLDCASAILTALLKGEPVKAYNISNPDSVITIKQMAQILANSTGVELKMEIPTEDEKKGFNPMSNSSLDSTELLELGWKGLFDAEIGFRHTVEILKSL